MSKQYPWRGEICKCCLRPNFVGFELDDKAWSEIVEGRWNILCIPCLDSLATAKGIDWTKHLVGDLYPCSSVGWSDE